MKKIVLITVAVFTWLNMFADNGKDLRVNNRKSSKEIARSQKKKISDTNVLKQTESSKLLPKTVNGVGLKSNECIETDVNVYEWLVGIEYNPIFCDVIPFWIVEEITTIGTLTITVTINRCEGTPPVVSQTTTFREEVQTIGDCPEPL